MTAVHHDNDIDTLRLFFTSVYLANIFLHKSKNAKFCPFMQGNEELSMKIREDVGGSLTVFRRKAVVSEIFVQKSKHICKSIYGIDASQLYRYSIIQLSYNFDSEMSRSGTQQFWTPRFQNIVEC